MNGMYLSGNPGIVHAMQMPGLPDRFMPFSEPARLGVLAARTARFTYGPLIGTLCRRAMRRHFDVWPPWRVPGGPLTSGYAARW